MLLIDPATCLAVAIYFEARSELPLYQIKVAEVIMNRVESKDYPDTICGVIKEHKQFSFLNGEPELSINKRGEAWKNAKHYADTAMRAGGKSTAACHYAHTDVNNSWTRKFKGQQHGNHIFYEGGC